MIEIKLTQGKVAIVDDDCPIDILKMKWYYGSKYAVRNMNIGGKIIKIILHRLILDAPKGMQVDHINGNRLDNRRENLRICTQAENCKNRKESKNNTSGYKGVSICSQTKKYKAVIQLNRKKIFLGRFKTAKEAAIAYNEAAVKYHGEFANLNKID